MCKILKTAPFVQEDHGEYSGGGRDVWVASGDGLFHCVGMEGVFTCK